MLLAKIHKTVRFRLEYVKVSTKLIGQLALIFFMIGLVGPSIDAPGAS